jgi:hypothetical protein
MLLFPAFAFIEKWVVKDLAVLLASLALEVVY